MRHTILIAAVVPAASVSAPAIAAHDSQLWTTQVVNLKLGGKWRLQEELVERFSDTRHGLYEVESNTLLGYRLGKTVTVGGGYTHDPQYTGGHFTVMERRLREQVTFDNVTKLGPGKLSFRMRLEQRWRTNIDGTGWRLRPSVKYSLPQRDAIPEAGRARAGAQPDCDQHAAFEADHGRDRLSQPARFRPRRARHQRPRRFDLAQPEPVMTQLLAPLRRLI